MDLLVTLEDLWTPVLGSVDQHPIKSAFIAQTSGGVVNALDSFSHKYFSYDDCVTHVCKEIEARRILFDAVVSKQGAHPMTFKNEFLNLSRLTTTGFLVIVVKRGNVVMSVDMWKGGCQHPSALRKDEARQLFASGAMAVAVNTEANTVMTHFSHCTTTPSGVETLRLAKEARSSPERASIEEETHASKRVIEMRTLVHNAHSALCPETWAMRRCASESVPFCPSTES